MSILFAASSWLSCDVDYDRDHNLVTRVSLSDDIRQWCRLDAKIDEPMVVLTATPDSQPTFGLDFESPSDAVLFKLRWC